VVGKQSVALRSEEIGDSVDFLMTREDGAEGGNRMPSTIAAGPPGGEHGSTGSGTDRQIGCVLVACCEMRVACCVLQILKLRVTKVQTSGRDADWGKEGYA
jgi:hypothetical protein